MTKLRDLDASFTKAVLITDPYRRVKPGIPPDRGSWTDDDFELCHDPRWGYDFVQTLAEADGIWFLCPLHFAKNLAEHGDGRLGTEMISVGFAGRCPPGTYTHNLQGVDTRWQIDPRSTGLDDLILTPSIQVLGGPTCDWHGFVGSSGVPPGEAA